MHLGLLAVRDPFDAANVALAEWGKWQRMMPADTLYAQAAGVVLDYTEPKGTELYDEAVALAVDKVVAKLGQHRPECQRALVLLYIRQYSRRDIASHLGIGRRTVDQWLTTSVAFVGGCFVLERVDEVLA